MLSLNFSQESEGYWQNVWKILIYDEFGRDILSPLYTVDSLHKAGVTLHLMLHSVRQEVPDVPAVYFVMPTKENINRICQDCANHLYESCYVNFISAVPDELLEEMARATFLSDTSKSIIKVHDQYANYVSLEENLFTLNQANSYFNFNNPLIQDHEAKSNISLVVNSLFSVLVSLGKVPIIQCPKGTAASMIAEELNKKLADHLRSVPNLFSDSSLTTASYQRPVLLLLDRNVDLKVMLSHSWSYQSLVHDVFDMKLNRVEVAVKPSKPDPNGPTPKSTRKDGKEVFDFDETDPFWAAHAGSPISKVIVSIQQQIEVTKRTEGKVKGDVIGEEELSLQEKISSIPELNRQKEVLHVHSAIAQALVEKINERQLDVFFTLEEVIMMNQGNRMQDVIDALESDKGSCEDKLRLFLIYYISNSSQLTRNDLDLLEKKLQDKQCSLLALRYLQRIKSFEDHLAISASTNAQQKKNEANWLNMFSSIVSKGVEYLNILPVNKSFYVTRVIESVMENKPSQEYLYLDPRWTGNSNTRKTTPFKEAIVFMVGGGNYLEYQNIMDQLKPAQPTTQGQSGLQRDTLASIGTERKVLYGTTELLTGTAFLGQLQNLGNMK